MVTELRRTLATVIIMVLSLTCALGHKYTVYSVIGKAYTMKGGKKSLLASRSSLSGATRLLIEKESAVTIIDEANSKMYFFTKQGENSVSSLLDMSRKTSKNLSRQYLSYLLKQMFSPMSKTMKHPDTYMQSTGTSYRAVSRDSMMAWSLARLFGCGADSTLATVGGKLGAAESRMIESKCIVETDYDVSFELVSCTTGMTMGNVVPPNTACYVRVRNSTDLPLYVNVLNIDDAGAKYLVLPIDEEITCSNMLVPAQSTVGFSSDPFVFSDQLSRDAFIMVASEEPLNFSILMNPIKCGNGENMKLGVNRRFYDTRK